MRSKYRGSLVAGGAFAAFLATGILLPKDAATTTLLGALWAVAIVGIGLQWRDMGTNKNRTS